MAIFFKDPASPLPGEADLLAYVVDDLFDEDRKLVYADWLNDHNDDLRGDFLREFVRARQSGTKLPKQLRSHLSWQKTCGLEIERGFIRQSLTHLRAAIFSYAQPIIYFDLVPATNEMAIGETRIGGLPDVPEGIEWPLEQLPPNGNEEYTHYPFRFIGQLRFGDLRSTIAGKHLADGYALFFLGSNFFARSESFVKQTRLLHFSHETPLTRIPVPALYTHESWEIAHPWFHLQASEAITLKYVDTLFTGDHPLKNLMAWKGGGLEPGDSEMHRYRRFYDSISSESLSGQRHNLFGLAVWDNPPEDCNWQLLLSLRCQEDSFSFYGDRILWHVSKDGFANGAIHEHEVALRHGFPVFE